jgi:hypothetical protein
MAIQLSVAVRNARLDQIEVIGGADARLAIFTGSPPADCATANSGSLLVLMTLPTNYMNDAASGQKTKTGTWQDASADGTGTAGYFRLFEDTGDVCFLQGTVGEGSGDLQLDNTDIAAGQQVTVTTFTLTDGNA